MRVILSNGRQFIVKVRYTTEHRQTHVKDEFQRDVYVEWEEHNTALTITEWFKEPNMSKITVTGFAHCNYQDQFNKNVGKTLAYFRALDQLENLFTLAGMLFDEFNLVGLVSFFHKLNSLLGLKLKAFKRKCLFNDFFHFCGDCVEVVGCESFFNIKVVIKSAVNSRANGQFRLREQPFNSLRKNV